MNNLVSSPDTTLNWQSVTFPQPVYVTSVFHPHKLQPQDLSIRSIHHLQPDWMAGVMIFCFLLLAWGQVFYPRRIRQIYRAPFSKRFINQLMRDGNLFRERIAVVLSVVFLLSFSLLVFIVNERITRLTLMNLQGLPLYFLIVAMNLAYITAKVALIQLIGTIFKTRETTVLYLLNLLIFALITGPLLLAGLVLIIYLKSVVFLFGCIILFISLLSFRFLRGFFIGLALRKFSYLFLFVYLCSLEILPLLVLVKVLLLFTNASGA